MCAQLDGVLIAPVGWGWIPKVFTKIRIGTAKIQQVDIIITSLLAMVGD